VSWYQKGKTNLDFTEARDSEWQWHQLGNMQICTLPQTDYHASTPPLSFYRLDVLLLPNLQCQSSEGKLVHSSFPVKLGQFYWIQQATHFVFIAQLIHHGNINECQ